jgi:hypothetical protein
MKIGANLPLYLIAGKFSIPSAINMSLSFIPEQLVANLF